MRGRIFQVCVSCSSIIAHSSAADLPSAELKLAICIMTWDQLHIYTHTHTRRVWATWRRFLFSPGIDLGREFQCFLIFRSSWTLSLARHSHILHLTRHTAAVIESVFITSPSLDEDLSPTFDHQHDDHNTTRISFHIFIFLLSFFSIFIKSDNREGIGQTNSTDFFLFLDNQLPLHDSLSVSMDIYWCSSGLAGRKGVKSS